MSITLNPSDFQCIQDQLLELKSKNYELAEKNRRSQADFEAAKAKICTLQLKLEEQERDFQITSSTLRREIEAITSERGPEKEANNDEDYKNKYKKLLHKAKELQQRYEKSVEIVQQLDREKKYLSDKIRVLEGEQVSSDDLNASQQEKESTGVHRKSDVSQINEELSSEISQIFDIELNDSVNDSVTATIKERDELKNQVTNLTNELMALTTRLDNQSEENKMNERKGIQIVKELKRQLAREKNRSEVLEKRLEVFLSQPQPPDSNADLDTRSHVSTSSSANGNTSTWSQADVEAAKTKICTLQLKLEEQERDFQITSSILRREIEAITSERAAEKQANNDEYYKNKYYKLLHKAKELQLRYEKSIEIVHQLDREKKYLNDKALIFEEELVANDDPITSQLSTESVGVYRKSNLSHINDELSSKINQIFDVQSNHSVSGSGTAMIKELKSQVSNLTNKLMALTSRLDSHSGERKTNDRKGNIVKDLKKELAREKNRSEVLQKLLESILSRPQGPDLNADLENRGHVSTSSSADGNSNNINDCNDSQTNNVEENSTSS